MQVNVVSDSQGNILLVSAVPQKGATGPTLTPVLKSGERMDVLDVPAAFEKRPQADMHTGLHVVVQSGRATLSQKP